MPWDAVGTSRTFVVPDQATLFGNPIVLGRKTGMVLREGPLTLTLALPGATPLESTAVEELLRPLLAHLLPLFPGTPASRHLMVYFRRSGSPKKPVLAGRPQCVGRPHFAGRFGPSADNPDTAAAILTYSAL